MKNSTKIIQQFLNGFTEDVFGGGQNLTWGAGDFTRYAAEKSFLGSFAHVS